MFHSTQYRAFPVCIVKIIVLTVEHCSASPLPIDVDTFRGVG